MDLTCPKCESRIEPEDVNVSANLAKCGDCGGIYKASDLTERLDPRTDLEPPTGSAIGFRTEGADTGILSIPRGGLGGGMAFPMLFAAFWVGFMAFWTWGASRGSYVFAAFSIPFWVIGLGMWRGIIIGICESQEIRLGSETLSVIKRSPVASSTREIPYRQITSIAAQPLVLRDPFTMSRYMRHAASVSGMSGGARLATVTHGTKKTRVAENVSEAEVEWLVRILKALVHDRTGRRV